MKALTRRLLSLLSAVTQTLRAVFAADLAMYRHEPKLAIVTLGGVIVPTLYALIYLSSVWNPMRRTDSLTAAIVDHDLGTTVESRSVNVGHSMIDGIVRSQMVRVQRFASADEATRAVRDGRAAFALMIDEDFSRRAVRAERPGATIRVYIAEGNSSVAAMFARRFASEVATQTNASLARQRWGAVFARVDENRVEVVRLNDAVHALHAGSSSSKTAFVAHTREARSSQREPIAPSAARRSSPTEPHNSRAASFASPTGFARCSLDCLRTRICARSPRDHARSRRAVHSSPRALRSSPTEARGSVTEARTQQR